MYSSFSNNGTVPKIIEINDFEKLSTDAFNTYKEVKDDALERKKKRDSHITRLWTMRFFLIFFFILTLTFFVSSFLSLIGCIKNDLLSKCFLPAFGCFISSIVGFVLGMFVEKSN